MLNFKYLIHIDVDVIIFFLFVIKLNKFHFSVKKKNFISNEIMQFNISFYLNDYLFCGSQINLNIYPRKKKKKKQKSIFRLQNYLNFQGCQLKFIRVNDAHNLFIFYACPSSICTC